MLQGTGDPKSKPKTFTIKTPFLRQGPSVTLGLLPFTPTGFHGLLERKCCEHAPPSPGLGHPYERWVIVEMTNAQYLMH